MRAPALVVALLLGLIASTAALADDLDREVLEVGRALHCPICLGLSVADSPSDLARQMRETARSRLAAGDTREQVLRYFVDRYGEEVLREPPKSGFSLLAWIVPMVGLSVAAAFVARTALRWRSRSRILRRVGPGPA